MLETRHRISNMPAGTASYIDLGHEFRPLGDPVFETGAGDAPLAHSEVDDRETFAGNQILHLAHGTPQQFGGFIDGQQQRRCAVIHSRAYRPSHRRAVARTVVHES
jgi:hypothetical protein